MKQIFVSGFLLRFLVPAATIKEKSHSLSHLDICDRFFSSHHNNSWWDVGFVADSIVQLRQSHMFIQRMTFQGHVCKPPRPQKICYSFTMQCDNPIQQKELNNNDIIIFKWLLATFCCDTLTLVKPSLSVLHLSNSVSCSNNRILTDLSVTKTTKSNLVHRWLERIWCVTNKWPSSQLTNLPVSKT